MVGEIRNGRAGGEARVLSTPCSRANTSISGRSSSVDYRSFLTTETPIPPPAEKFENRPLGPTISFRTSNLETDLWSLTAWCRTSRSGGSNPTDTSTLFPVLLETSIVIAWCSTTHVELVQLMVAGLTK